MTHYCKCCFCVLYVEMHNFCIINTYSWILLAFSFFVHTSPLQSSVCTSILLLKCWMFYWVVVLVWSSSCWVNNNSIRVVNCLQSCLIHSIPIFHFLFQVPIGAKNGFLDNICLAFACSDYGSRLWKGLHQIWE